MKKIVFVLILSLLMLSGCGNSVKNDLPKKSDTKNNDSTGLNLDITEKTYTGTLQFLEDKSKLFCQSPDNDNLVVLLFNTKSDIGKKIFSICNDGDTCKITGKVKWLHEDYPKRASAVGEFISIKADGVQRIECLHLKYPVLPKTGRTIYDFVPTGWKLIDKAVGDLNKDGLPDMAGVIEEKINNIEGYDYECSIDAHRILFIAFNKGNGRYKLSIQNNDIILTPDGGGLWGDPFVSNSDQYKHGKDQKTGIFVNRGSLLIKFYGGTSWRWGHKYRFRYQNKGWYLIGYDYEWFHTSGYKGEDTEESYNYLTGEKNVCGSYYNGPDDYPEDNSDWKWGWGCYTEFIGKEKLINLDSYSPWEKD